jgi:hypothetical protein
MKLARRLEVVLIALVSLNQCCGVHVLLPCICVFLHLCNFIFCVPLPTSPINSLDCMQNLK